MRKLTSITAGWLWLAVAFGLSTLVGMGVLLIFFLAGCQDAAHAQFPSLQDVCYTGGRGDVIRLASNIVLLTLMAGGTLLATVAAGRHLAGRRRESPQAWALLTTTLIAAVVASSMVIRFLPYNGIDAFTLLLACLGADASILIVGAIAAGIASFITRRRVAA